MYKDEFLKLQGIKGEHVFIVFTSYSVSVSNNDDLVTFAIHITEGIFSQVLEALKDAGWVTSRHLLGVGEWRYHWE